MELGLKQNTKYGTNKNVLSVYKKIMKERVENIPTELLINCHNNDIGT